jgi:hypothetical protein
MNGFCTTPWPRNLHQLSVTKPKICTWNPPSDLLVPYPISHLDQVAGQLSHVLGFTEKRQKSRAGTQVLLLKIAALLFRGLTPELSRAAKRLRLERIVRARLVL